MDVLMATRKAISPRCMSCTTASTPAAIIAEEVAHARCEGALMERCGARSYMDYCEPPQVAVLSRVALETASESPTVLW